MCEEIESKPTTWGKWRKFIYTNNIKQLRHKSVLGGGDVLPHERERRKT